jgi:hypothetical protein
LRSEGKCSRARSRQSHNGANNRGSKFHFYISNLSEILK